MISFRIKSRSAASARTCGYKLASNDLKWVSARSIEPAALGALLVAEHEVREVLAREKVDSTFADRLGLGASVMMACGRR